MRTLKITLRVGALFGALLFSVAALGASVPKRVAVWFNLTPLVTNHHVGVTAFGNSEKLLENDWSLDARLREDLLAALDAAGVEYVVVDAAKRYADILGPKCFGGWSAKMKADCGARFDALLAEYGATHLLDVSSGAGAFRAVGPNPAFGFGLYTRGTQTPNIAIPYAFVYFVLYDGKTRKMAESANPHHCGVGKSVNHSPWSKDVEDHTIDDLAWLRPKLESLIRVNVDNAMSRLKLSSKPAPTCTNAGIPVDPDEIARSGR